MASSLSIALRVRRISGSYIVSRGKATMSMRFLDAKHGTWGVRTVVDSQPGHGEGGRVRDTVDTCRRVENLDVLS